MEDKVGKDGFRDRIVVGGEDGEKGCRSSVSVFLELDSTGEGIGSLGTKELGEDNGRKSIFFALSGSFSDFSDDVFM